MTGAQDYGTYNVAVPCILNGRLITTKIQRIHISQQSFFIILLKIKK